MHKHNNNKITSRLAIAGLMSLLTLSACMDGPSPARVTPGAKVRSAPATVQAALCEGRAADAVLTMAAEPLAAPSDRFYTALALEEAGQAVRARRMYADLMSAGYDDWVSIRCGKEYKANGPISEEAGKHLAMIARTLQAMDVAMAPATRLGDGLPSLSSTNPASGTTSGAVVHRASANTSPMTVTRPSSQTPLGRWFVHLASYRSVDHVRENKVTLEKQFPALAGVLDQWEVDVNGLAIRIGVRVDSRDEARALCNSIKSQGAYCAVLDTQS
ncbi:MAG: hypothetical protein EP335_02160 [Alphaproteobacteria bacterium]|nr:MAG: hypothetical protein EP335_02160 [Alphaproteobacteria bacterium]